MLVYVKVESPEMKIQETVEVANKHNQIIAIDYGDDGWIIGVEILSASLVTIGTEADDPSYMERHKFHA